MSEPNANRDKLDQRVTNLESLFTHLEKTVSDLDGVVVDGHKKIEELSNKVDNLEKKSNPRNMTSLMRFVICYKRASNKLLD